MYLFFDTETTGLSRHSDHVVQVAWILADEDGDIVSEACHVIRPDGFSIPWQAAQIHGISTAIAQNIGEPLDWVLEQLSEDVGEASVVVAHNLSFDLGILQNDYKNAGLEFPFHGKTQVCTMKLSTTWCRLPKLNGSPGFKYPKLEELHYRLFGEAFDDAHDALADTQACMRCYFKLVELDVIDAPSIPATMRNTHVDARPSQEPPSLASHLAYLATHHDPEERIGVATNLVCPAEVQILLTEDADVRVVAALAENPRCSKEVFALLAKNDEVDILIVLGGNQSCPPDVLSDLYDRFSEELAEVLVCNPSCPPAVLADICWTWPDDYAAAAHANPSFSEASFQALLSEKLQGDSNERSFLAEFGECPPNFLRQLAYDTSWVVRKYVARNPATPPDVLLSLSRITDIDSDDIDAIDDSNRYDEKVDEGDLEDSYPDIGLVHVRWYAKSNPSNPLMETQLEEATPERLAELAEHEDSETRSLVAKNEHTSADVLSALVADSSGDVRAAVAGNLFCPKNLFATLCNDKTAAVRLAAANNYNCSIAGLKVLAASRFYEYRELAARHKNCTRDLFETLANDPVASVRKAVIENNACPIEIRAPLFMTEKSQEKSVQDNEGDEEAELLEYEPEAGVAKDSLEVFQDRLEKESFEDMYEKLAGSNNKPERES